MDDPNLKKTSKIDQKTLKMSQKKSKSEYFGFLKKVLFR